MGVSPSAHEPVRIAPMAMTNARHGDSGNGHQYDRGSVYDDHGKTTAASDHDDDGATPRFSNARRHDETRGGSRAATTSVGEVCQNKSPSFVVGRSSERLSAAEAIRGGGAGAEESGRAGRGQSTGVLRADSVAASIYAAEVAPVGHDEWKEACTAQGKM